MIRRIVSHIRAIRIAHHNRVAQAAGAATLDAQRHGDFFAAAGHLKDMHAANAKRDRLIDVQLRTLRPCRPDPELLDLCADQMSAAQLVAHHRAGELKPRHVDDIDWTLQTR